MLGSAAAPVGSVEDLIDAFVPQGRPSLARAFDAATSTGSIACDAHRSTPDGGSRWIRLEGRTLDDGSHRLAGLASEVRRRATAKPTHRSSPSHR